MSINILFDVWTKFIENILSCSWNPTHCSHSPTHEITSLKAREKTFPKEKVGSRK
jgi:hypothetical protein